MKLKTYYFAFLLAACAGTSQSHAVVLAEYAFNSGSASATNADANVTAEDFTVGSGLSGGAGFSGSSNSAFARSNFTFGSTLGFSFAKNNSEYLSVTIGPDPGYYMDLDSFTFDFGYTSTIADTADLRYYVTTSVDNHTNFLNFDTVTSVSVNNPTPTYPLSNNTDLSAFNYVWDGNDIEFRIYLIDEYNANDVIHRIDNVILNGTIAAVPEPSSTALLGLGALAIALRRKRG